MTVSVTDLLVGFHSHKGPRETNQDTVLSIELPGGRWLAAVADGMGGLDKGEMASKTALGVLYRYLSDGGGLVEAAREANSAVHKEARGQKMGTTLVAALLDENTAEVVNVGDSRAYHLDPLGLVQVTRDHTMGADAVLEGSVTESQLASSPWADALSRYLGAKEEVDVDHFGPFLIQEGGWLLLCSDGFHRVFSTAELDELLSKESDPEETAHRLVEEALERNTGDNVSVALIFRPGGGRDMPVANRPTGAPPSGKPRRILVSSRRTAREKRRRKIRAIVVSLVAIPILVGIIMVLRWWLSAGAG